MLIGESYIGEGAEAAHVNTVFGERSGPVGVAWATALASPSAGHTPFVAVVIPGLPVKPMTLFVNKAPIAGDEHGTLTWGAAQAGVAGGVADAVTATREALRAGVAGMPQMVEVLAARHRPFNPFYSAPSGGQEPAGERGQEPAGERGQESMGGDGREPAGDDGQARAPEPQ